MARRCLGKGSAVWQVLNAKEEKDEMHMEVEEPVSEYVKKGTTVISYTSEANSFVKSNLGGFNIEEKLTYNIDSNTSTNFGSPFPCIQPEATESKILVTIITIPHCVAVWQDLQLLGAVEWSNVRLRIGERNSQMATKR